MIAPAGADSEYERSTVFTFGTCRPLSLARLVTSATARLTRSPTTSGALTPERVVARDRVDAPARQAERDDERRHRGDEPAPMECRVRAHLVHDRRRRPHERRRGLHDRRRLAQHPRDERGGGRDVRRMETGVDRPRGRRHAGQRGRFGPERDCSLDGVAAVLRPERKEAVDEGRSCGGRSRCRERQGRGGLVRAAEAGREPVLALEGHAAGEEPEEDAPERVEIGRRASLAAGGLLGGPVLGRPRKDPRDGRAARRTRQTRKAEVGDEDAARAALDEDVRRGQVAVDDAARVRVRERRGHGRAVPPRLVPVERPTRMIVSRASPSTSSMTSTVWPSFSSTS